MTEFHPRIVVEELGKKFCHDRGLARRYAWRDLTALLLGRFERQDGLRKDEFWAFRGVSFALNPGDSLAVLGRNGAGKSTVLKLLAGRLTPTEGSLRTEGTLSSLGAAGREFRAHLTGRENIHLAASSFGRDGRGLVDAVEEIAAFAELGRFIDSPVSAYSTGMKARLGFAVSAVFAPEILLVDEALAVGDLAFQRKCITHIRSFLDRGGILVLVTHDPHLASSVCRQSLLMHDGRGVVQEISEGVHDYLRLLRERERDQRSVAPAVLPAPSPSRTEDAAALAVLVRSPVGEARSGEPAEFVVRVRSQIARLVNFGITVETEDSQRVVLALGQAPGEPAVMLPPGESEITAVVPYLPLAPGRFALRGFLLDARSGVSFGPEALGEAQVASDGSLRAARQLHVRQLAVLPEPVWVVRPAMTSVPDDPQK